MEENKQTKKVHTENINIEKVLEDYHHLAEYARSLEIDNSKLRGVSQWIPIIMEVIKSENIFSQYGKRDILENAFTFLSDIMSSLVKTDDANTEIDEEDRLSE